MLNSYRLEIVDVLDMEEYLDEPICPACGSCHYEIGRLGINDKGEYVYYCRACGEIFKEEW